MPQQLDAGVDAIERACALDPQNVELLNDAAALLTKAGLHSEGSPLLLRALDMLERAEMARPDDIWDEERLRTLGGCGGLLLQLGRDAEALAVFEDIARRAAGQEESWLRKAALREAARGRALALARLSRRAEAVDALEAGVRDYPDQSETKHWLAFQAELLLGLGRRDAALAVMETVVRGDRWQANLAPIWRTYAQALRALGREVEAQEAEATAEKANEAPDLVEYFLPQ